MRLPLLFFGTISFPLEQSWRLLLGNYQETFLVVSYRLPVLVILLFSLELHLT